MITIGIIGAMEEEVSALKEKLDVVSSRELASITFIVGLLKGKSIVIAKAGIGKVNAAICTQIMIDHFSVDYIINIGVAGALNKSLDVGDIVISKDTAQHDMDTSAFGDPIGVIPRMDESFFKADSNLISIAEKCSSELGLKTITGRIASGDQFVDSVDLKNKIRQNVKADCAEMEGAAIAQSCYLNKVPFLIIRSISDNAENNATISFDQFKETAIKNGMALIEKMLEVL